MFLCEISIISICQKLGSVGPMQQKIKLPLPYRKCMKFLGLEFSIFYKLTAIDFFNLYIELSERFLINSSIHF